MKRIVILNKHILVEGTFVRKVALFGKIYCFHHRIFHLILDIIYLILVDNFLIQQILLHSLYGVKFFIVLKFLLGAILHWIGHRMAAVTIGAYLKQPRLGILPNIFSHLLQLLINCKSIHAVDDCAFHTKSIGTID